MTNSINGTFRHGEDGKAFTWSFKKFEKWKKDFNNKYFELFGKRFKEEVKSSDVRQAIYETLLRVRKTGVFLTDTNNTKSDYKGINKEILEKSIEVNKIVRNII